MGRNVIDGDIIPMDVGRISGQNSRGTGTFLRN